LDAPYILAIPNEKWGKYCHELWFIIPLTQVIAVWSTVGMSQQVSYDHNSCFSHGASKIGYPILVAWRLKRSRSQHGAWPDDFGFATEMDQKKFQAMLQPG
jgi:hypothetical protein